MNDQQLLHDYATTRNAHAFRSLVEQYQRLVYSAASRRLANSHDIDDVVQSTFLKLAKSAGTIRRELPSWLYTTTINTANDLIRRDQTRRRHEALAAPSESITDDAERAEWNKLSLIIDEVLLDMREPDRALIVEHFFRGRSQRDLAEEMKVSQPTVLRRIDAAVKDLRVRLTRLGYTAPAPVLLAMLAKIPRPPVPASLTAELCKIGISGAPAAAHAPASGPAVLKLILGTLALAAVPVVAFFLLTAPPHNAAGGAQSPTPAAATGSLHGRILTPDGKAATGATVFIALPGPSQTRIRNGVADVIDPRWPKTVADASGHYSLPSQQGKFLLVALDDAGFVQANQDGLAKNTDVRMIAWGRLHGRLMLETKPGTNMVLQASSIDRALAETGPVNLSIIGRALTDANGFFSMDRLLPGFTTIDRNIYQQSGPSEGIFSGQAGTAEIAGGQTTTVTVGGAGRPVVGRFIYPEGMDPDDFFINARANAVNKNDRPKATTRDLFMRGSYLLEVAPDHTFRADNVPPGDYQIHIFLQEVRGDRTLQPNEPPFTMPPIPGGVSEEPLVISDIQLQ